MHISSWQEELRNTINDSSSLLTQLDLSPESISLADNYLDSLPLKVPQGFVKRMDKGNAKDPLLLQIMPLSLEDKSRDGFCCDPLGEVKSQVIPGILHKYHGRVLLVTTGACAIHCRYCFRRYFPYNEAKASQQNWQTALDYISKQSSISEVILSGGDPLVLSDQKLSGLVEQLEAISHLKRIRIHSRMPVVLPSRITASFVDIFSQTKLKVILVIHSNHPNELDSTVEEALIKLQQTKITVLNQSVLLRQINDQADTLAELGERLFDYGVLPYYLHMLDPVQGASHFDISTETATNIMHELRKHLPGYLVPKLVREETGAPYKIPIL